jgi:uncharacterized protein YceH (UPF0502 family)
LLAITERTVMADTLKQRLRKTRASEELSSFDDIYKQIQSTLETLAQLDQTYGELRVMLERWSGTTREKDHWRAHLEKLHREDRKPLVVRLAAIHEHLMGRSLQTLH